MEQSDIVMRRLKYYDYFSHIDKFDSRRRMKHFIEDNESSGVYACRTLERICNLIRNGKILVLFKLDWLYPLYDMLNQKYLSSDEQKYYKVPCSIDLKFTGIVAVQCSVEIDSHALVAFLNEFEKQYLNRTVLKMVAINLHDITVRKG